MNPNEPWTLLDKRRSFGFVGDRSRVCQGPFGQDHHAQQQKKTKKENFGVFFDIHINILLRYLSNWFPFFRNGLAEKSHRDRIRNPD